LHTFLREAVAPAAMREDYLTILSKIDDQTFTKIATYFVTRGGTLKNTIFDTHGPFTYYAALLYDQFKLKYQCNNHYINNRKLGSERH
jgi:hypothetical protein